MNQSVMAPAAFKRQRTATLVFMLFPLVLSCAAFLHLSNEAKRLTQDLNERRTEENVEWQPKPYTQKDISTTARNFKRYHNRLLLFDGESNTFTAHNLDHMENEYSQNLKYCARCGQIISLLVDALRSNFPERFELGQPPFQLVFSDADTLHSECFNYPLQCDSVNFVPILSFGSIPRGPRVLPSVKAFPNCVYQRCVYFWRVLNRPECNWLGGYPVRKNTPWFSLKPQIIWRGSDNCFLCFLHKFRVLKGGWKFWAPPEGAQFTTEGLLDDPHMAWDGLNPRWRALSLSLQAKAESQGNGKLPWIDSMFYPAHDWHSDFEGAGVRIAASERMGTSEQAQYRYHLDLGGGGGTSWAGTLTKLGMPGLLFHHETPTKDWFYDEIKPWVHYVPIKWDLSDLHEKFQWAEENPGHAERIAKGGTEFFLRYMSAEHVEQTYDEYYVQYLGKVVDAYVPGAGETVDSIMATYHQDGFDTYQISSCGDASCTTETHQAGQFDEFKFA